MGRPRIEINKEEFEGLCNLMCTLKEIAGWFKCSEDTIERWCVREYEESFADTYKKMSSGGTISLRRLQWNSAQKGNVPMQIWLGKQWLGQKDNPADDGVDAMEAIKALVDSNRRAAESVQRETSGCDT